MVITNRLGITDSPTLAREEERISKKAATTLFEENLLNDMPSGTWTTLQRIHTILFQDIYDFAGALRSVNIAKGNFRFVPVMYLAEAVRTIEDMPQSTFDEIVEKYVEMKSLILLEKVMVVVCDYGLIICCVQNYKRPSIGVRWIKSNICLLWNEVQ